MRRVISILLVVMLCLSTVSLITSAVSDDIKVYVDGSQVAFPDQKPFINADSRTLVPVRFVSEALGAEVEWDGAAQTVGIEYKDKNVKIGTCCKMAFVDGVQVALDTKPVITASGRTMVPLRFVSECLGAEVQWDEYKRAVYIITFEKEPKAFVGTALTKGVLVEEGNGSDISEPGAQYMFVTHEQLPVKFGMETIYSITPGPEYITVKQSTPTRDAAQMLIIQGGLVIGSRTDQVYPANPFSAKYDTQNACDVALGSPRVDINKVEAFAFKTRYGDSSTLMYLIIKNPLYKGDWHP